jgi:TatD DNase family protein
VVNKPIIIHSRKAAKDTLEVLTREMKKKSFRAVWHCFGENLSIAEKLIGMGVMLSFTGTLTYPSGENARTAVSKIPLTSIMLETDSPFLVPEPIRRGGVKINQPSYVKLIAEEISQIRGVLPEEIISATTQNALNFFSWPDKKDEIKKA